METHLPTPESDILALADQVRSDMGFLAIHEIEHLRNQQLEYREQLEEYVHSQGLSGDEAQAQIDAMFTESVDNQVRDYVQCSSAGKYGDELTNVAYAFLRSQSIDHVSVDTWRESVPDAEGNDHNPHQEEYIRKKQDLSNAVLRQAMINAGVEVEDEPSPEDDPSDAERVTEEQWAAALERIDNARDELARQMSMHKRYTKRGLENNEGYQRARKNMQAALNNFEGMFRGVAEAAGMDEETILAMLNSDGPGEAGFASELEQLRTLAHTIETHPEEESDKLRTRIWKKIGSGALKAAKFMGRHKATTMVASAAATATMAAATGGAALIPVAASWWAAKRGGAALTLKGYNTAMPRLLQWTLSRFSKLNGVVDRLSDNNLEGDGSNADSWGEAVDALMLDGNRERKLTQAANIGAVAISYYAGYELSDEIVDFIPGLDNTPDTSNTPDADRYDVPEDSAHMPDSSPNEVPEDSAHMPDNSNEVAPSEPVEEAPNQGQNPEDDAEQVAPSNPEEMQTPPPVVEQEITPEVPADFVYDVQKGDGITHAIFGIAQEMEVCDNLTGADYYAVYEMYEQQLGALDNTYDMGNGDYGLSDWEKDYVIDGELRLKIEEALRERAGVSASTVEAAAPAVDLSSVAEVIETDEEIIETTTVTDMEPIEDTTENVDFTPEETADETVDEIPVTDTTNTTETDTTPDTTINIDLSNIETDEVQAYVTQGIDELYDDFVDKNNYNIRDLSITEDELITQVFDSLKSEIAEADLDFSQNIDFVDQITGDAALQADIDAVIQRILDEAGGFATRATQS